MNIIKKEYDFDDNKLLLDLMRMKAVEKSNSISSEGLDYALSYANSGQKSYANQYELLKSDIFTCKLAQDLVTFGEKSPQFSHLKDSLKNSFSLLLKKSHIEISIHSQKDTFSLVEQKLENLFKAINPNPDSFESTNIQYNLTPRKHIFKIPQTVNYCVESFIIPPIVSPEHGKLLVLGELLTHSYLHREIREKGGAYGGGARISPSGLFNFYSYRDPNLNLTYHTYRNAIKFATDGKFSAQDIIDAKIVSFQKIDRAKDPAEDGLMFFTRKVTENQLNEIRKSILETEKKDICEAAKKYLKKNEKIASKAVCGMSEIKEEQNLRKDGWNIIDVGMLVHDKDSRIDF